MSDSIGIGTVQTSDHSYYHLDDDDSSHSSTFKGKWLTEDHKICLGFLNYGVKCMSMPCANKGNEDMADRHGFTLIPAVRYASEASDDFSSGADDSGALSERDVGRRAKNLQLNRSVQQRCRVATLRFYKLRNKCMLIVKQVNCGTVVEKRSTTRALARGGRQKILRTKVVKQHSR